jgi:outer membrane protein W
MRRSGSDHLQRLTKAMNYMTRTRLIVGVTMLALMAVGGSTAQGQEGTWSLRFNVAGTIPNSTQFDDGSMFVRLETNTDDTYGLALSGEYRFSQRLGLELGVQAGNEADVTFRATDPTGAALADPLDPHPRDGLQFTIVDTALNVYLASGGVNFYIGPVLGYILFDDLDILAGRDLTPVHITTSDEFAYGAVLGLDIPFVNSGWFFTSSLKYLVVSYDANVRTGAPAEKIDFDPLIARAGFGYRF